MFQLIVAVLSIVMTVLLAVASISYGGQAFQRAQDRQVAQVHASSSPVEEVRPPPPPVHVVPPVARLDFPSEVPVTVRRHGDRVEVQLLTGPGHAFVPAGRFTRSVEARSGRVLVFDLPDAGFDLAPDPDTATTSWAAGVEDSGLPIDFAAARPDGVAHVRSLTVHVPDASHLYVGGE